MKSSYITNLVLLTIVFALLWLLQIKPTAKNETASLSAIDIEAVESIQIERAGKVNLQVERYQNQWILTKPFYARTNPARIKLLLRLLTASVHAEFQPTDPAELNQFGLSRPDVILRINNEQFVFGDTEPLSHNRYVLYQGIVYLVQDDVMPLLTAAASSFVDNRLIPETRQLKRLILPLTPDSNNTVSFSLQNGQWHSDSGELSSDIMNSLASNWQQAYATQVRYLEKDSLNTQGGKQIQLWLDDKPEAVQLLMQQSEHTLHIINPAQRLQYDFPLAIQSQLLPPPPKQ